MNHYQFSITDTFESLPHQDAKAFCSILYEWYKIYHSPLPPPSEDQVSFNMRQPRESKYLSYSAMMKSDDEIVSIARIFCSTGTPNDHLASIRIVTSPNYFGKGYAKELLRWITTQLPDSVTHVQFTVKSAQEFSWLEDLLVSYGGKLTMSDRCSGVNLDLFDFDEVKRTAKDLYKEAIENGYDIIFIDNFEFPEGFDIPNFVKSLEQIWNDMPRDEMNMEDEEFTVDDFFEMLERFNYSYDRMWMYVCLKDSKTVGLTVTLLEKGHHYLAIQDDTGVIHEHRGNGLGKIMKYQMLRQLLKTKDELGIKYWVTHNAHSNSHMIKINTELKYSELSTFNSYEFELETLKKNLR